MRGDPGNGGLSQRGRGLLEKIDSGKTSVEVINATDIRVVCPDFFENETDRDRFLARSFEVLEVRSVEIDVAAGFAVVRRYPSSNSIQMILEALSDKLSDDYPRSRLNPLYYGLPRKKGPLAFVRTPQEIVGIRRPLYKGLGCFFAGMSMVGVLSPFVPTSPFILLGAYFLLRSSTRLHDRMLEARVFGPILDDFYVHGGLRRSIKQKSLIFIGAALALSIAAAGFAPSMLIAMGTASLVSLTLMMGLPTIREEARIETLSV
ncbi:MAG: inner membrane protein YbaN [Pseudomonadota bacterium]